MGDVSDSSYVAARKVKQRRHDRHGQHRADCRGKPVSRESSSGTQQVRARKARAMPPPAPSMPDKNPDMPPATPSSTSLTRLFFIIHVDLLSRPSYVYN
jgi:hypothetical protein